jgi:hypothetical protein
MRVLGKLTVFLLAVPGWAASVNDYLPSVGPAPLRFAEPAPPLSALTLAVPQPALRELPSIAEKTNSTGSASPVALETAKTNVLVTVAAPVTVPPVTATTNQVATIVTAQPPMPPPGPILAPMLKPYMGGSEPQVAPIMLIKYFKPECSNTDTVEAVVPMPVNFVPPPPSPIPSSTATYISP